MSRVPSTPTEQKPHPMSIEQLTKLERLVAIHCTAEGREWPSFVALLRKAGFDVFPQGIRHVG